MPSRAVVMQHWAKIGSLKSENIQSENIVTITILFSSFPPFNGL